MSLPTVSGMACPNSRHGVLSGRLRTEFDPECATCSIRKALSEHDHLHLGEPCPTGQSNVRCKCGGYHH